MIKRIKKNYLRRKIIDGALYAVMAFSLALVLALIIFILVYIFKSQEGRLNLDFITNSETGILPMIVTTMYVVLVSLIIALPIGIGGAVFLNEYSGSSSLVRILRLAVETLAGIPSIIYGLFGLLMFCRVLSFGQSIIAGSFTLAVMILPVIVRTTEEALKSIPGSFREASLALGATKFQTIIHIVLPSSLSGIITSAILAIGRVAGESAPVLLTVGLAKNMPSSIFESGRTLSAHLYYLSSEAVNPEDFAQAFASASALIIIVVLINVSTKIIAFYFNKKTGASL